MDRRHARNIRSYAEVDTRTGRFYFARAILSLPRRHRLGLLAHEVGHVLAPRASERGADRAARRVGVAISYDPRWPTAPDGRRGLQTGRRINPPVNETVVEYAVREMFKGKSPRAAANATAKKLSGKENVFLGSGIVQINPRELEEALWSRIADSAIVAVRAGRPLESALVGALQKFGQHDVMLNVKPGDVSRLNAVVASKLA